MQLLSALSAFTTKTGFIQQQNTYRRLQIKQFNDTLRVTTQAISAIARTQT